MATSLAILIPALLLGCAALAVLLFLGRSVLSGVKAVLGGGNSSQLLSWSAIRRWLRLRQRAKLIAEIERALMRQQYGKVQRLFQKFFTARTGAGEFYEEGLEALRTLLRFSDKRGMRISNLALLEELLLQRQNLAKKLLETEESLRRHRLGAKEGAWAAAELTAKLEESKQQLELNQNRLQAEVGKLLENFRLSSQPEAFTVH